MNIDTKCLQTTEAASTCRLLSANGIRSKYRQLVASYTRNTHIIVAVI